MATATEYIKDLKRAVVKGDAYGFEELLNKRSCAGSFDIDAAIDSKGTTLLHLAATHNRSNLIAKALLSRGASVDKTCQPPTTPLHFVAHLNACQVALALIDAGADVSLQDKKKNQSLHLCASNNGVAVAHLLLQMERSAMPRTLMVIHPRSSNSAWPPSYDSAALGERCWSALEHDAKHLSGSTKFHLPTRLFDDHQNPKRRSCK